MGIVARQSAKNTVYSFMGIGLATFYTIFIMPKVFSDQLGYWGVLQLIMSYVTILSTFSLLGIPNVFIRFAPVFKDKQFPQFLFFGLLVATIGFILMAAIFLVFQDSLMKTGEEKNPLFVLYLPNLFIILYCYVIFSVLMYYARMNLLTSFPTFLNESFMKFLTLGLMLLFWYKKITFYQFMWIYSLGYLCMVFLIMWYLYKANLLKIKVSFEIFRKPHLKPIAFYGLLSILNSGAITLTNRLDIVMVGRLISLDAVALYATGYFFITVLLVPVRSMLSIASPLLSGMVHSNDPGLKGFYNKTMLNIFITSGFVYLFIVFNINPLMELLGETFGQVKYVVLILASAKLLESLSYLNMTLIVYSKYFKYDFIFQLTLLGLTVVTNLILIPKYGLEGAALATALSILINTVARWLFVFYKFKVSGLNRKTLIFALFLAGCLVLNALVGFKANVYMDILIRSFTLAALFVVFLFTTKISQDINDFLLNLLNRLINKTKI